MRKLLLLVVALAAIAAVAVPAMAATKTKTVNIGDIWFISAKKNHGTITVAKGTKVTWKWTGNFPHNLSTSKVPAGAKKFTSKVQKAGTFSQTLTKPGTYVIYCKIHSAGAQSMKLVVK